MKKENANRNKKSMWLLRGILAAAFCCAGIAIIVAFRSGMLMPPVWVEYQSKAVDLKGYFLEVGNKKARLSYDEASGKESEQPNTGMPMSGAFWLSDPAYKVQDGFLTDLDRDGDIEMVLLVWKRGRYGKHRPFFVTSDEKSYSQHIFIYDIEDGVLVRQKWFASDIGVQVKRMKLMEQDNALMLTEDTDGNCVLWKWESFGLKSMDNEVKFVAFGDNIIHSEIYDYARAHEGGSYDFLYEPFREETESADVAMVNAETVLVDKESAVSGYPLFGSPIEVGQAFKRAGFDVISCANNHALDKGIYGIDVTGSFYRENGMTCVGIQESDETGYRPYEVISRNGMRIAVLSYTYGTNGMDISDKYPYAVHYLPEKLLQEADGEIHGELTYWHDFFSEHRIVSDIELARTDADFVVIFAHWGDEYRTEVTDYQRQMTSLFAKAGADVVIGSHPHVVQKAEVVDRPDGGQMLVYYSLGNFRAYQKGRIVRSDEHVNVEAKDVGGAKALFTIEHAYDGVRIKSWEIKEIDSFAP